MAKQKDSVAKNKVKWKPNEESKGEASLFDDTLLAFCKMVTEYWVPIGEARTDKALHCLAKDIVSYIKPEKKGWKDLNPIYKDAWVGEIKRRFRNAYPTDTDQRLLISDNYFAEQFNVFWKALNDTNVTGASSKGGTSVETVLFSQFCINTHFQTQGGGSPEWVANQDIVVMARKLRGDPALSLTMSFKLYWHAKQWVTINNRGFAMHCLANVTPYRFVFTPEPSADELNRFNEKVMDFSFDFGEAIPQSRKRAAFSPTIPTSVTAMCPEKSGQNRTVICTIKADFSSKDAGNEEAYNAVQRTDGVAPNSNEQSVKKNNDEEVKKQ
jgi:hypothetical protein